MRVKHIRTKHYTSNNYSDDAWQAYFLEIAASDSPTRKMSDREVNIKIPPKSAEKPMSFA